ncbi:methyltransferase-like protein 25B [Diadema setosum]|uniref:methyltransferase-like protein 25B n=1 Tax=Diadema setosum TaxID=31175 RepID=UPI003B3B3E90
MPTEVTCSTETVSQLRVYVHQLHTLARHYKGLTDSYVVEFFVKNHWDRLPKSWHVALRGLSYQEVVRFLLDEKTPESYPSVWPLSLLCFRAATHGLALDPTPREDQCNKVQEDPTFRPIDLLCRLHVKAKKRHEILRMAKVINSACHASGAERVVDVGSGQGHLSRLLSFGYGLPVTSIEAVGCHLTGAAKVDTKIKTIIQKRINRLESQPADDILHTLPQHVESTIHPGITVEEFLSVINNQSGCAIVEQDKSIFTVEGGCLSVHSSDGQNEERNVGKEMSMHHHSAKRSSDVQCAEYADIKQKYIKDDKSDTSLSGQRSKNHKFSNISEVTTDQKMSEVARNCNENLMVTPSEDAGSFALVGLHTCGDLAPTMLRVFAKCKQARALASVACCYMKMESALPSAHSGGLIDQDTQTGVSSTEEKFQTDTQSFQQVDQNGRNHQEIVEGSSTRGDELCSTSNGMNSSETVTSRGFPMSKCLSDLGDSEIQFEALELACHSLASYKQRLKDGHPNLVLHGYRATLELLIQGHDPALTQSHESICRIKKAVASIRKPHLKSFKEYAATALSNLGIPYTEGGLEELQERFQPQWNDVLTFHVLRSLMGPIIESLVLTDRVLFLYEQGIDSKLVPIFDSSVSPRNFVLKATKDSTSR